MADFIRSITKRDVEWCEGGHGYGAFCPSPTDPSSYKYCCTIFYLGSSKPSCCPFPVHIGVLIASCIACIVLFLLLLGLYCWCWPTSRLNTRRRQAIPDRIPHDEMFHHRRDSFKSSVPFY